MAQELIKRIQAKPDYEKIIKEGKIFTDPEFPPDPKLLEGYEDAKGWAPATKIFKGEEKVYENFEANDIVQGELGDCYWLSAISALAEFPGRVERLFPVKQANEAGCYAVTLYICGQPLTITVDENFPVTKGNKPAFADNSNKELWVLLLEKAWAKLHQGFQIVEGGDSRESLSVLTGAHVEYIKHKSKTEDAMWLIITLADKNNYVMTTGSDKEIKGIKPGHAYSLINTYEILSEGKPERLVQIRNPWGQVEWEGDWCDKDPKWTPELNAKLHHTLEDDGTFFMKFSDFYTVFIHTFIAKIRDDYVSSHFAAETDNLICAFKVANKLTCHISSYQITGRLGRTVKKDHKTEPQTIALYKIGEHGDPTLVANAPNNAVGIATVEVTIGSGTYLIHSKFEKKPFFPYIGLAVNGEKAVDLIKIDAATPEEAVKSVEAAFKAVKKVYSAKTSSPIANQFNKCTKGHLLAWSTEPCPLGDICEGCREKYDCKEGRWSCKACGYDVCILCRPKEILKKETTEGGEVVIKCGLGHKMNFEPSAKEGAVYLCDKCGKAYLGPIPRWRCEECDQDICYICVPPSDPSKMPKELPEIDSCFRGHELTFTERAICHTTSFECDICGRLGNPQAGRWACFKCNINICPVCKPSAVVKGTFVVAKSGLTVCEKNHPLEFTSYVGAGVDAIICDKCSKDVDNGNWRWSCLECKFDVCVKCRPEPEGRKDVTCKMMHKLTYSVNQIGNTKFSRCDKCHKAFDLTKGRYGCVKCEYELCKTCLPPDPETAAKFNKPKTEIMAKQAAKKAAEAAEAPHAAEPEKEAKGEGPCNIF